MDRRETSKARTTFGETKSRVANELPRQIRLGIACMAKKLASPTMAALMEKFESFGMGQLMMPATVGFAIIGMLIIAHAVARFYTTEIAITNKHLITKPGIIARNGTQLIIAKCESCNLRQSVLGRILNYGSIVVSGAGDTNAVIPGISNPLKFQDTYAQCYRQALAS